MTTSRKVALFSSVVVIPALAISALRAQTPSDVGSLSALTAEIRQLRLSIEEGTKAQTQTQALAVYLTVQKDRILQVATRLDGLRRDLDAVADEARKQTAEFKMMETALPNVINPEERAAITERLQQLRRETSASATRVQTLQTRESELVQSLQAEETRWTDLVSRLERAIKR